MADNEQLKKIKCPHCGWVRSVPIRAVADVSETDVARRLGESMKATVEKIKTLLAESQLDEANALIDMPACTNCGNVYQYNVRTGERRR